jgi:hypothetical protein|nr:MAG TPA: hypothetical protein [Caudoviricetes sp.]
MFNVAVIVMVCVFYHLYNVLETKQEQEFEAREMAKAKEEGYEVYFA